MASVEQTPVVQLFEKLTVTYGGRFDLSRFRTPDSGFIERLGLVPGTLIADARFSDLSPKMSKFEHLYIDYVDNWDANAVSILERPLYIVGLWIGLPIAITNFFFSLLRYSTIFSDVGVAHDNEKENCFPRADFWNYQRLLRKYEPDKFELFPETFPRDQERRLLLAHLSILAFDFVRWHELMHITCGHLDYINRKTGRRLLYEFEEVSCRTIAAEISQALELHADTCATTATVDRFMNMLTSHASSLDIPRCAVEPHGMVRLLTFVFGTVFFLLDNFARPYPNKGELSHPNARIRSRNAIIVMKNALFSRGITRSEVEKGCLDAIKELKAVSEIIGVNPSVFNEEREAQQVESEKKTYGRLLDCFHSLRRELDAEE